MKRIVAGMFAFAVVLAGASYFAADESYVLNIKAHLEPPPTVVSKNILKNPLDLDLVTLDQVDAAYLAATGQPPGQGGCIQADTNPPIRVRIGICVFWVIRITINNPFDNPIANVIVKDRYGAELAGEPLDSLPVHVEVISHSRGNSGQESFDTQYRILWCVTGNLNMETEECDKKGDDRDLLQPGEVATLDMLVFTKLNPSGRQEYTTACEDTGGKDLCYELNSGANAKWIDTKTGAQMSQSTDPIKVGTYPAFGNSVTLNTPIDFGTVYPGEEVREHFELLLSETFLAEGTDGTLTYSIHLVPGTPNDISPYIKIVRDESEDPEAADAISSASLSEPSDLSDLWWVIFTAPDCADLPDPPQCEAAGVDLSAELVIVVDANGAALPP